jgi:hypothetical protein
MRKEAVVGYFKQISWNIREGSDANDGKPQNIWWSGRYSNWALPEYKSGISEWAEFLRRMIANK